MLVNFTFTDLSLVFLLIVGLTNALLLLTNLDSHTGGNIPINILLQSYSNTIFARPTLPLDDVQVSLTSELSPRSRLHITWH